jgi:hypothetical protein
MSRVRVVTSIPRWWETDVVNLFGIAMPVLPTAFALAALWVGREIARNPRRKLNSRQNLFLNIGLVIVTFLVVTGRMFGTQPLELGWASVMGFGIGMNGLVIFEIFQNITYAVFTARVPHAPAVEDNLHTGAIDQTGDASSEQ